jgi:foldase protein PrsA
MKTQKTSRFYLTLAAIIIFSMTLSSAVTFAAAKVMIDPVVVKVNDEAITETEFLYFLMGKYGDEVVDQLIEHILLAQQASQFGLTLDKQDGWDVLNDRYTGDKMTALRNAFDLEIIATALARELLALDVLNAQTEKLIVDKNITVSDEDILAYYLDVADGLVMPAQARVAWIVTTDKASADKAKARLDGGEDFGTVAKDLSEDDSTKDLGGEVDGVIVQGATALPAAIMSAIFSQEDGTYSDVITVESNHLIVKTIEKLESSELTFEEVKPYIEKSLLAQKVDEPLAAWLKGISDSAEMEIIYPIFQEIHAEGGMTTEGSD